MKAIGIDFGTTNSLIAFAKNDKETIIIKNNGGKFLPSVVGLGTNKQIIVGKRAKNLKIAYALLKELSAILIFPTNIHLK